MSRQSRERRERAVQVMHKTEDKALAVGKIYRFKSGAAYEVLSSGAVKAANSKPYLNKAERKKMKRAMREAR